ncbi:GPC5C protein, partial [Sagittarius serpentarius]|nr:GPC5C protein [Sagittarius serpentarius]
CRMGAAAVLPAAACVLLALLPAAGGQTTPPSGCGKDLSSLYYNLCDLSAAWGIVLEAVAGLGVVTSFVLTIVLVASLPFMQEPQKKSLVATQVFFLLGTFGLFCLTFDFIVGPDFSTCTSRRFLFGVLFGICFSCLLAHAVALNFLVRRNRGPRGWVTLAVALLLALVEVIINAEWLIITVARQEGGSPDPCRLADADFVMALIYVMFLLVAAFGTAWPALCGRYGRWRKHGAFILTTTGLSMAIWVVWMVMYLYGNQRVGEKPGWDDPTLAIALVSNACAFLLLYIIPEVTHMTRRGPEQAFEDDVYPTRGVGYETILKEQKSQSMFVENKAFSMDEPSFGCWERGGGSPLAFLPWGPAGLGVLPVPLQPPVSAPQTEGPYDMILPRASTASPAAGSASSTLRAEDAFAAQARHAGAQRDGRSCQVQSPYGRNRW